MEKKLCRLITLISTFLIHHCSHLVQMSCISAVNPREEPQLADTLPNLPFDSRPVLSCHELVHLCGCHAFKEAPHSALETVDFFFFSVCDFETQQKKIFFWSQRKGVSGFLLCSAVNHKGARTTRSFFFSFYLTSLIIRLVAASSLHCPRLCSGVVLFSRNTLSRFSLWSHSSFSLHAPRATPPLASPSVCQAGPACSAGSSGDLL